MSTNGPWRLIHETENILGSLPWTILCLFDRGNFADNIFWKKYSKTMFSRKSSGKNLVPHRFCCGEKTTVFRKNNEKKWQLLRKANSLRKGSGSDSSVTMGFKNRRVHLGQVKWPREKIYPGRLPPKLCVRQTRSFFCSRKNHGPRRHPGKYLLDGMTGWYVLDGYLRVQSYQTSGSYGICPT